MTDSALAKELRALSAAFTFMTRLPLGRFASHDERDLRASVAYFPVVGIAVGVVGGLTYGAARLLWPISVSVLLAMVATVYATGAFHEDALADTLDGFGGGRTPERILEIMKDSRVGSYALVGVVLVLGLKFVALASIAEREAVMGVTRALVAGHVVARWSSVSLMMTYSYARPGTTNSRLSAGGPFASRLEWPRAAAATLIAGGIGVGALGPLEALTVTAVAVFVTMLAGTWFERRIGGITGDTLGATNQIVELSVYLALVARV